MADLVASQGRTAFLIQALNKLGVCSSHDTLKQFIQRKLDAQVKNHPYSTLFNLNTFTVISVDNIDFLHSYARVFKGTNNSCWHGTTVQLVQPLPSLTQVCTSLNVPARQTLLSTELDKPSSRKRLERCSPVTSPLKLTQSPAAKLLRRACTGTECKREVRHQQQEPLVQLQHSEHRKSIACISVNDFLTSETENESLQELHHDLFIYMTQKLAVADSSSDQPFISIQDYFSITRVCCCLSGSNGCYCQ